jgi:hypothetical protein
MLFLVRVLAWSAQNSFAGSPGPGKRYTNAPDTTTRFTSQMIGTFRATEACDLPQLAKFLVRVYGFGPMDFHFDPTLLRWKYLYPRNSWHGDRSYLIEKDRTIIAHAGVCPVSFRLPNGQVVRSLTIMDWAADPAVPLAGVTLFRKLMVMAPTSFVIGGAAVTRKILPRIGFRLAGEVPTYAAWSRPWREFRSREFTGRSAARLLHGLTHPVRKTGLADGWECLPVGEFDDSLRPLLMAAKRSWTLCQRTVADLNYLLKCPHLEVRGFLLRWEDRLIGYFVMARSRAGEKWEGRVLDFSVDSDDVNDWEHACSAVTNAAWLDHEICRIRVLSTVPLLSRALERNGYWRQYKEPIMIHDAANALERAFPIYFQLFDGDSGY